MTQAERPFLGAPHDSDHDPSVSALAVQDESVCLWPRVMKKEGNEDLFSPPCCRGPKRLIRVKAVDPRRGYAGNVVTGRWGRPSFGLQRAWFF